MKNKKEILQTNVCFRCGEVEPIYDPIEEVKPYKAYKLCMSCGDYGVVKISQLIDIVNDLEIKGILGLALSVDTQEEFVDAIAFKDVDNLNDYIDD